MNIMLNGKEHECTDSISVSGLLNRLEIHGKRVAVMVNDQIVKKDLFDQITLTENDDVEVIQMVGGG